MYSSDLEWVPQGNQAETFESKPIKPVDEDILICKLSSGQRISLEAHAVKGIGATHAKWSPVATASYRMHPAVEVDQDQVQGALAQELVQKCPLNVFDIEELPNHTLTATAARPRDCTMCRECIREEGWQDRVRLFRKNDHFICKGVVMHLFIKLI